MDGSGGSLESALPGREEREMSGKGDLTGHQAVRRRTQTATTMVYVGTGHMLLAHGASYSAHLPRQSGEAGLLQDSTLPKEVAV